MVLRLPEGLDLRRSTSHRRSAPVGAGRFVRQTAATERASSTFHAARTPRRSGPSYNRRWPRRSGAFRSSHGREPVRQTTANLSGIASTPIGFLFRIIFDELGRGGTSMVQASLSSQPQGCLISSPQGILLQNTHRRHAECSEEADVGQRQPGFRRIGQEMDFFRGGRMPGMPGRSGGSNRIDRRRT